MAIVTEVISITVREAVGRYTGELTIEDKQIQQQELNRFVRDLERVATADLTAQIVEKFQEDFERTGADSRRLEPIKLFLAYAHKKSLTDINYGKFIRIRRTGSRARGGVGRGNERVELRSHEMLTADGFQRLQEELDTLITVKRPEIAHDLQEARIDKDFRENAPFDAAKQHQAEVEARIRQLQAILARAEIIDGNTRTGGRVSLGSRIVLHDIEEKEDLEYRLVSPNEANPKDGRISVASPVGRAVLDRSAGEIVEVEAPGGIARYRIDKVAL
ncbi:MAG: transcription elongation factor GreA [Chloroflexota bacterium]|nr:MAG: transcription elongation factor GreA [Chloroflexota bacterium]